MLSIEVVRRFETKLKTHIDCMIKLKEDDVGMVSYHASRDGDTINVSIVDLISLREDLEIDIKLKAVDHIYNAASMGYVTIDLTVFGEQLLFFNRLEELYRANITSCKNKVWYIEILKDPYELPSLERVAESLLNGTDAGAIKVNHSGNDLLNGI